MGLPERTAQLKSEASQFWPGTGVICAVQVLLTFALHMPCLLKINALLCFVKELFHFSRELHNKRRHGNFKYISAPGLKAKDALQTPQQNVPGDRKPLYCLWEVPWSGFTHLAKIHC